MNIFKLRDKNVYLQKTTGMTKISSDIITNCYETNKGLLSLTKAVKTDNSLY